MRPAAIPLRVLHRSSAIVAIAFLVLHLANHLAGLSGQATHIAAMTKLRAVYRNGAVEPVVLFAFTWQIVTGLILVVRDWRNRRGIIAWAQAVSGLYLAAFLAVHVCAVLAGRSGGLDTNFNFAAAGMHAGAAAFFVPYYFAAVLAVGTHVGCAVYWWRGGTTPMPVIAGATVGALLGSAFVMMLAGSFYAVDIPDAYLQTWSQ